MGNGTRVRVGGQSGKRKPIPRLFSQDEMRSLVYSARKVSSQAVLEFDVEANQLLLSDMADCITNLQFQLKDCKAKMYAKDC